MRATRDEQKFANWLLDLGGTLQLLKQVSDDAILLPDERVTDDFIIDVVFWPGAFP